MPSARARKPFAYPTDDTSEPTEGIDEQEQEELIQDLHAQDESTTAVYTSTFLGLPLLSALTFLPNILSPPSAPAFFSAILAISSLAATAYILYYLPLREDKPKLPPGMNLGKWTNAEDGPLNKAIVPLNGALAVIVSLRGLLESRAAGRELLDHDSLKGALPFIVYVLILAVRWQLKPIDTQSLEKLKYGYKGA